MCECLTDILNKIYKLHFIVKQIFPFLTFESTRYLHKISLNRQNGTVDEMGGDKIGADKMGVDKVGSR